MTFKNRGHWGSRCIYRDTRWSLNKEFCSCSSAKCFFGRLIPISAVLKRTPSCFELCFFEMLEIIIDRIHVWYIYLHLVDFYG